MRPQDGAALTFTDIRVQDNVSQPIDNHLLDHIDTRRAVTTLGENQSSIFIVKDREHRFRYVNERFANIIGKTQAEIIGLTGQEVGLSDDMLFGCENAGLPGVQNRDEACMSSGTPMRSVDGTVNFGNGEFESSFIIRTPLFDREGTVVGVIVQAIDEVDLKKLEHEMQQANDTQTDLDTLDALLAEILSCHDHKILLQKITDVIVSQTLAEGAYVAMPNSYGDRLELVAGSGQQDIINEALGMTWQKGEGLIGTAWSSNEIVYTKDANADGATYRFPHKTQFYALPVTDRGQVVAVMAVTLSGDDAPSLTTDFQALQRIVNLAGIAITNANLIGETQSALTQTRTVAGISQRLATMLTTDEASQFVCDALHPVLPVDRTSAVLRTDTTALELTAETHSLRGSSREVLVSSQQDAVREADIITLAGECIAMGVPATGKLRGGDTVAAQECAWAFPVVKDGNVMGAICVSRQAADCDLDDAALDVLTTVASQLGTTLERHGLATALHHLAYHDRLTQLPNRHHLESSLQAKLDEQEQGVLLFIDLDGFKEVNDSLSHRVGDALLQQVAARLSARLGHSGLLARMGSDEFAWLKSTKSPIDPNTIEHLLLDAMADPFHIESELIRVGASIGLSRFPQDGDTVDALLTSADVALHQAKQNGKGQLSTFDENLGDDVRRRAQLQADLRIALEEDQFELHFQPQVACDTGRVSGVEALLRWTHPERGSVSPGEFIPVAEASGIINAIGSWVLDRAIKQLAEWQHGPLQHLSISINIAASQFQQDGFSDSVLEALRVHQAPAERLEIEMTESLVMSDVETVVRRLNKLRAAGMRIAVDDFGTGYSSLSYLQDLPLDVLKIDRAFVTRLQKERIDQSVANTIALLANGLGLETVAEGVETTEQRNAIVSMGCHKIQGFYYSKPVPASDLPAVVSRLNNDAEFAAAA